jgi:uncharacterized protein (TIGR03790 family)
MSKRDPQTTRDEQHRQKIQAEVQRRKQTKMGRQVRSVSCVVGVMVWLWGAIAWGVPGPDSVVVVANKNDQDSVGLAQKYAKERAIPPNQICLLDLPQQEDITQTEYQQKFLVPLEQCLQQGGSLARIEAVVLMRGVPLRVGIVNNNQTQGASLAAVVGVWKSTYNGKSLLTEMPGRQITCSGGAACLAARWTNPFRTGVFRAGYQATSGGVDWKPLLVTMLHGRSYADAEKLLTSALDAEAQGAAKGQFMLMKGADSARGALDGSFPTIETQMKARGWTDTVIENFNSNLIGRSLGAFFVGTASLGNTIEGNIYLPGSITDNLTSFGAAPTNFRATGQSQVSIARWVAKGVAGAHGTTDEPLNNCFPNRALLLDYVDGSTLAEAYHRHLPYVYWRNLVLGDPMAAPYAKRPKLTISGATTGSAILGSRRIKAQATEPSGLGIAWIALFVDGKEVGRSTTSSVEVCVDIPTAASVQILAVAQTKAKTGTPNFPDQFQPKGWAEMRVVGQAGPQGCLSTEPSPESSNEPTPESSNEAAPESSNEPTPESSNEAASESSNEPTPESSNEAASEQVLSEAQLEATSEPTEEKSLTEIPSESTPSDGSANEPLKEAEGNETHSTQEGSPTQNDAASEQTNDAQASAGCGCTAPPTGSSLWWLLVFGGLVWRRKKRHSTMPEGIIQNPEIG